MSSSLLVAPCLWLAFRESIGGARPRLLELSRGHWIAIAVGMALTLPLMFSAHLGHHFCESQAARNLAAVAVHPHHDAACASAFSRCRCRGICLRCRRILLERLHGRSRHWAQLPLVIVFTTWALAILRTVDCAFFKCPPVFSLIVAIVSVGVTVGALYLLLREFSTPERGAERQLCEIAARRADSRAHPPQARVHAGGRRYI